MIQAVSTYKSLVPYVSTTLLSRLITKKIWQNAQLWEGFIRLARAIAPSSFGALLQLPKEQLRDLVGKQSSLKAPLRDYVVKSKSGTFCVRRVVTVRPEAGHITDCWLLLLSQSTLNFPCRGLCTPPSFLQKRGIIGTGWQAFWRFWQTRELQARAPAPAPARARAPSRVLHLRQYLEVMHEGGCE